MKLLIKFPTRNRPAKFIKILNTYYSLLDDKSTKFIISCDDDDETMNNDGIKEYINDLTDVNIEIFYNDNKSKIEAVNANMDNIEFDIVLLASDDMVPVVQGFDTIIKNKMTEHYTDTDGVLWFNDGYQGNKLNTLCILGKKYYDRFNYIYNPEYKSVWSDNEFMDVANILNKQTYFDEVIIRHEHPDWGFGKNDLIHQENVKNESNDRTVYNKRKLINFGI
jgi:hypothetical protein